MNLSKIAGIFITHEHSDHICGAGILSRRHNVPLYANSKTWAAMRPNLGKIKKEFVRYAELGESVTVGDITLKPFPIPHDAACPVGYNIFINDKKLTIATDIGHMDEELLSNMENSEMVLLESNHDVNVEPADTRGL